jgi:hypothetical protein
MRDTRTRQGRCAPCTLAGDGLGLTCEKLYPWGGLTLASVVCYGIFGTTPKEASYGN